MIIKIGHGSNIMGALLYNFQKVDAGAGRVMDAQNIMQSKDGNYSTGLTYRSFEVYLLANRNTEKPALHISINPDPKDKVDDNKYIRMAGDYMREMGYGEQPYIIFKHTDIERTHIHIVSTNVDQKGKKISDTFEHRRSMDICRKLELKYGLIPPGKADEAIRETPFRPVDYTKPDIKSQIAAVVRYLPNYYHYQSLGAFNALLSLFNITAQEVSGELNGQPRIGLVYFALDRQGEKASHPFKASLFGKSAGHTAMVSHFERSRNMMNDGLVKPTLKSTIEVAMHSSDNEQDFKDQLKNQGINIVTRRNLQGRVYGITFVDHTSKSVWNGSQLGKELSANAFEQWWDNGIKANDPSMLSDKQEHLNRKRYAHTDPFLFPDINGDGGFGVLGNLLPNSPEEDYEERAFENRMKKKRKRK